MLTGKER